METLVLSCKQKENGMYSILLGEIQIIKVGVFSQRVTSKLALVTSETEISLNEVVDVTITDDVTHSFEGTSYYRIK